MDNVWQHVYQMQKDNRQPYPAQKISDTGTANKRTNKGIQEDHHRNNDSDFQQPRIKLILLTQHGCKL